MAFDSRGRGRRPVSRSAGFSSFDDDEPPRSGGGSLFLWTIILLLLVGFALGCWIFSFYVFGHPEKSFSYSILTKLKKLEPLKRFEITAAPRGEFLTANQLADRYGRMTDRELERASEVLLRNYLRNYKLTQDRVPYIIGSFNILDSYELDNKNLFPSGVVALAQSTENGGVLLEHVFTANKEDVLTLQRMLLTGLDLKLDRTLDLSAIINVKRLQDGRLQFTAVPILYGSYASSTGPGTFSLTPPTDLHMASGLPVLDDKIVDEANQKYSAYRLRAGLDGSKSVADGSTPVRRPQPQLVRVERPKMADESVQVPPVATPTPAPSPAEPPVRPAVPVTAGAEQPSPSPAEAGASPTPGFAGTPTPTQESIANTGSGNWPTYSPGQMPRGRLSNIPDMTDLAGRGLAGERIYLQGNFVVTAAGQNRAVLRANNGLSETLGIGGKTSNTRIIVEYPSGTKPPTEGATFSRDSRRPFLITDVKKGADGQVNVYVREITRGQ